MELQEIMRKVDDNTPLSKEEAVLLLNTDQYSVQFYQLLSKANELSRKEYGDKGYVFVQIGLNGAPCSGNCKFCSMGNDNYVVQGTTEKTAEEVLREAKRAVDEKADALFLMTTADYSFGKFLDIAKKVKRILPEDMMFIANIGDFGDEEAGKLKEAGFTGIYHIVRLGEGTDTDILVEKRIQTLEAIRQANLELIYCVEPIGPEHTYEQIADEMIRARNYDVNVMACMKRVGVPGTPLHQRGEITNLELTKIVAVARLVTRPKQSMNVHEPEKMALLAGVNQLYAEIGINPRDCSLETQTNRGYSVLQVADMLRQVGYQTKGSEEC
ncbi:MAG: radical SAM protein [Lachnospiraceae bacterium]